MKTREAVRAMIPVSFAVNRGIDFPPANFARKTFLAGVMPVIILIVTSALVLTVHCVTSSSLDFIFSWEALKFYSLFQTPRPETVSVNEFLNAIKFSPHLKFDIIITQIIDAEIFPRYNPINPILKQDD